MTKKQYIQDLMERFPTILDYGKMEEGTENWVDQEALIEVIEADLPRLNSLSEAFPIWEEDRTEATPLSGIHSKTWKTILNGLGNAGNELSSKGRGVKSWD